jgi:hypothetical protein
MRYEALEPGKFIDELRPRLRIAIGKIEAADQHTVDGRFDIARFEVERIARQTPSRFDRVDAAGEDSDPVVRTLAAPDRAVAGGRQRCMREARIGGLDLLKASDIRARLSKPT